MCVLRLKEELEMVVYIENNLLNKEIVIIWKCYPVKKYTLALCDSKDSLIFFTSGISQNLFCIVKSNGFCTPKHPFVWLGMMILSIVILARFIQIYKKSHVIC